jgi:hypothetical protein
VSSNGSYLVALFHSELRYVQHCTRQSSSWIITRARAGF